MTRYYDWFYNQPRREPPSPSPGPWSVKPHTNQLPHFAFRVFLVVDAAGRCVAECDRAADADYIARCGPRAPSIEKAPSIEESIEKFEEISISMGWRSDPIWHVYSRLNAELQAIKARHLGKPRGLTTLSSMNADVKRVLSEVLPEVKTFSAIEVGRAGSCRISVWAPHYGHDCTHCKFLGCFRDVDDSLGSFEDYDLYQCDRGPGLTYIARFGSEGYQYKSGRHQEDRVLLEAERRHHYDVMFPFACTGAST